MKPLTVNLPDILARELRERADALGMTPAALLVRVAAWELCPVEDKGDVCREAVELNDDATQGGT